MFIPSVAAVALARPIPVLLVFGVRCLCTVQDAVSLIIQIEIETALAGGDIFGVCAICIVNISAILPAVSLGIVPVVPRLAVARPRGVARPAVHANGRTVDNTLFAGRVEVEVACAHTLSLVVLARRICNRVAVDRVGRVYHAGQNSGVPAVAYDASARRIGEVPVCVVQD